MSDREPEVDQKRENRQRANVQLRLMQQVINL